MSACRPCPCQGTGAWSIANRHPSCQARAAAARRRHPLCHRRRSSAGPVEACPIGVAPSPRAAPPLRESLSARGENPRRRYVLHHRTRTSSCHPRTSPCCSSSARSTGDRRVAASASLMCGPWPKWSLRPRPCSPWRSSSARFPLTWSASSHRRSDCPVGLPWCLLVALSLPAWPVVCPVACGGANAG